MSDDYNFLVKSSQSQVAKPFAIFDAAAAQNVQPGPRRRSCEPKAG